MCYGMIPNLTIFNTFDSTKNGVCLNVTETFVLNWILVQIEMSADNKRCKKTEKLATEGNGGKEQGESNAHQRPSRRNVHETSSEIQNSTPVGNSSENDLNRHSNRNGSTCKIRSSTLVSIDYYSIDSNKTSWCRNIIKFISIFNLHFMSIHSTGIKKGTGIHRL